MLDFTPADLKAAAERLLALQPDPVPRLRLLRDVLKLGPERPPTERRRGACRTPDGLPC